MQPFARFIFVSIAALLTGCMSNVDYMPYTGAQQKWPTASGALVSTKYAVPVYRGLPDRPYIVLGAVASSHGQTWLWTDAQAEAMEAAANEAKKRGGDAIVLENSSREYAGTFSTGGATTTGSYRGNVHANGVGDSVFGTVHGTSQSTTSSWGASVPMFRGNASVLVIKFK
jgi:hypothetical protein